MSEKQNILQKILGKALANVQVSVRQEKNIVNRLGINSQSILGQMISNFQFIRINQYLTILGNESIEEINEFVKSFYPGEKFIVAYDIWGGIFALNNGDFSGDTRNLWYMAPDTLRWENLNSHYSQFVYWACSEKIDEFYKDFFWTGMKRDTESIGEMQAVLFYPFLWSNECTVETASKKIVPLKELIALNAEYAQLFGM